MSLVQENLPDVRDPTGVGVKKWLQVVIGYTRTTCGVALIYGGNGPG
jgi:hypothetical protein